MLMTKSEYAKSRGLSKQLVNYLSKTDRLILVDGKVDSELSDAKRKAQVNPAYQKPKKEKVDDPSFSKARARHEESRAEKAQLELGILKGEYVEKAIVHSKLTSIGRVLRDGIENIPARVGSRLVGLSSQFEVEQLLKSELKNILNDLCNSLEKLGGENNDQKSDYQKSN